MALSKKMKKILADFYAAKALYDEAHERGDRKEKVKLGGEFIAYMEKFQKESKFSDEALKSMKDALATAQKDLKKEEQIEAELEAVRREIREGKQKYYGLLLEQQPQGKKRTKY